MKNKTTDINKKIVSWPVIIIYIIISIAAIVISIIWGLGLEISRLELLKNGVDLFFKITSCFGIITGITIYDTTKNDYYKFAYGKNIDSLVKLEILADYDKNKIKNFIWETINTNKEMYWNAVYELQESSENFRKIWNDYNYYTNQGCLSKRLKNTEKAVFSMVYKKIKNK